MKVKRASASLTAMNLPCTHVSTFEFGQARPTYYRWMKPSESVTVDLNLTVRCAPLLYPAYGNAKLIHRGFFVPSRLISPHYDKFLQRRKINVGGVSKSVYIPYFRYEDLLSYMVCSFYKTWTSPEPLDPLRDFSVPKPNYSLGSFSSYDTLYGTLSLDTEFPDPTPASEENVNYIPLKNLFVDAAAVLAENVNGTWKRIEPNKSKFGGYDFYYCLRTPSSGTEIQKPYCVYCRLNPYGRFILKVMDSLGYKLTFPFVDFDIYSSASGLIYSGQKASVEPLYKNSANSLALLSFCRILGENYIPSQFAALSDFDAVNNYLNSSDVYTNYSKCDIANVDSTSFGDGISRPNSLMGIVFVKLLQYAFQLYAGSDYFTDAWYNQNSVISGAFDNGTNDLSFIPNDSNTSRGVVSNVVSDDKSTQFSANNPSLDVENLNGALANASAVGHKWLNSIYNLFMRSNLAGSRYGEYLLSVFGVKAPASKLQKSVYLGKKESDIIIADITATSSTDGADGKELSVLGEYAGKGFAIKTTGSNYHYEAEEEGIFMVITSLVTSGGYVQGIDRNNLILDPLDFYHPELEKTGMQPTLVDEFLAPPSQEGLNYSETDPRRTNSNYRSGNCFGFLPRYSFMKYSRDFLSGDFNVKHLGGSTFGELHSWHMFRMFGNPNVPVSADDAEKYASQAQLRVNPVAQGKVLFDSGTQYNRIFNVQDNRQDHFFADMFFSVKLETPMISMENSIDLDGFREEEVHSGDAMN